MTSTVRSVRVVMEADVAGYIANIRLAGHETDAAFSRTGGQLGTVNRGLKDVDTSSKQAATSLKQADTSLKQVETSSSRTGKEVDKLSGRLGILRDVGLTLGPALIPLAEGILPAITGGIAGIGAGASAIGVAVLALHGLGAGIKALDAYKLDPTIQNLEKLRQQEEKLGPAGVQFLHYVDQLEPKLRGLQQVARAGWFPGLETGINDLLQRLPLVRGTVKSISEEMGSLSSSAGHALSSSEWRPFFQYVRSEAAPTLDAFAHSAGNVALGLANMLVAFGPASSGFASGLEEDTRRFADWSKSLDQNKGFQNFLSEVRRDGHEALQLLSATVSALGGLVQAAQPLGQVTLPILTDLVKVFAAVAGSKVGPALYAAAAAMIFYNRATQIADKTQKSFQTGMLRNVLSARSGIAAVALLADQTTGFSSKLGLANTSMDAMAGLMIGGPWGAALGAGIGLVQDITSANDAWTTAIQRADDALRSGDTTQMQQELASVNAELAKVADAKKPIQGLDDIGRVLSFGHFKNQLSTAIGEVSGQIPVLTEREHELQTSLQEGGGAADLFGHAIGLTGRQMQIASGDAAALDRALAHLNGWFSKRDAVYAYKDAVDALTKGLKDGFNRKDAEQLDQVGESILQVANQIKNPAHRADFLQAARGELESIAKNAGPQAKNALRDVIAAFDDKGLTHPIKPKIDPPDTKPVDAATAHVKHQFDIMKAMSGGPTVKVEGDTANLVMNGIETHLRRVSAEHADPKVQVDPGNSIGLMGIIERNLAAINGSVATATIRTVHVGGLGPQPAGSADGSTVPKGGAYADRYHYMLAPGEEVISNRYGQADRNRPLLKAINAGRMAAGGTAAGAPPTHPSSDPGSRPPGSDQNKARQIDYLFLAFVHGVDTASTTLKSLNIELKSVQAAYTKEKQKLTDLTSTRDSLSSSVSGSLIHDPFGNGLAGLDAQVAADTGDITAMAQALSTLVQHGLDPKSALYQALAASDDVNTAQQLAALSSTDLSTRAQAFQQRGDLAGSLGSTVANGVYAQAIAKQTEVDRKLAAEIHQLNQAIKDMPKHVEKGAHDGSKSGSAAGSEAGAAAGTKRGMDERNRTLGNRVRTGG